MNFRKHRLETLETRLYLDASALRITEFMASNSGVVLDAEGDDPDWLEIYNSGQDPVELQGLYLTDDPNDLARWEFGEQRTLDPGELLLVFASGKNQIFNGHEIHTSFSLSAGGEYLAIVDADGTTIIDEYAPQFPQQQEDISYGLEMITGGPSSVILAEGSPAKALIPANDDLGLSWTELGFDDSAWPISGPASFGYENSPNDGTNYVAEIETSVPSGTTSLYYRITFDVASRADLGALTLNMRFDDGFAAYINGQRVESQNAPDSLAYNSTAGGGQGDNLAEQLTPFDISDAIPHIRTGENVLAVHALNLPGSSDMLSSPQLVAVGTQLKSLEGIGHFTQPTPGWGNGDESVLGYAESPEFSVPHGFYETAQQVAITSPTPDALIVYTTNGSMPEVDANLNIINGAEYVGPLDIDATTTLRARAFKQDFEPSFVKASTYIFLDDVIQQSPNGEPPTPEWPNGDVGGQDINYGIDPDIIALYGAEAVKESLASISTFSITTDLNHLFHSNRGIYVNAGNRGRSWEREASVEYFEPDGADDGFTVNAGLRIRGGFSRTGNNPKHAFRLFFRGDYGDAKLRYPVFGEEGTDEFDVLDLRTSQNYSWAFQNNSQNTFLREVFARDLQRDMDQPYTRSRYHHLYINGAYWGLFMTQERIQDHYGETYLGGDESDYDVVKSNNAGGYVFEVADGNDVAWRQLFDLAQALYDDPVANADNYWTMQGLNPDGTRNPDLPVLLDVENVIDYVLIIFYTGGFDTGISNFLGNNRANNWQGMYNRAAADQGFQFFMHDNEHSLGTNNTDDIDRTGPFEIGGNHTTYQFFNPHFLHQDLLSSSAYVDAFSDRARMHLTGDGVMTPEASIARMTARMDEVEPAIIAEAARWGDSKRNNPFTKANWENEVNSILNGYFPVRTNLVINQLQTDGILWTLDTPTFNHPGGTVPPGFLLEMDSGDALTLYTSDGTDPRAPDGTVNRPSIARYDEPLPINSDQTILARSFDGGAWSQLVTATFIVALTGDYNGDGSVDGADLTVWETEFDSQEPNDADGNADGVVDGLDFLALQRNYGASGGGAAAAAQAASSASSSTTSQVVSAQSEVDSSPIEAAFFTSPAISTSGQQARRTAWTPPTRSDLAPSEAADRIDQALAALELRRNGQTATSRLNAEETTVISADSDAERGLSLLQRSVRDWVALDDSPDDSFDVALDELFAAGS